MTGNSPPLSDPRLREFFDERVRRQKKRRRILSTLLLAPIVTVVVGLLSHLTLYPIAVLVVCFGLPMAGLILISEFVTERAIFPSFLLTLLAHATTYTLVMAAAFRMVSLSLELIRDPQHPWAALGSKTPSLQFQIPYYLLFFLWILLIRVVVGVSHKMGPGILVSWLLGRYRRPRQEELIFMFLDLRDSTALGERLGDLRFSDMIREFFADITGPVIESRGRVSHFIGDAVVLYWTLPQGLAGNQFARCFYHFRAVLESRSEHYIAKYGVVPGFKAGAHFGTVVATEVGKIKSEIVFHGDVLNTTARIQDRCGAFDCDFLVSAALAERMERVPWATVTDLGESPMKGKAHPVRICRVELV